MQTIGKSGRVTNDGSARAASNREIQGDSSQTSHNPRQEFFVRAKTLSIPSDGYCESKFKTKLFRG